MGADEDSHQQADGCPGMWRLTEALCDLEAGALTVYVCELCGAVLTVPPGGVHPSTS